MTLLAGDCIEQMRTLEANSVDAIVTDPPYGLKFMGKEWDGFGTPFGFQTWTEQWAREALRVLKPGGHLLAFGGTRMYHRLAAGIDEAAAAMLDEQSGGASRFFYVAKASRSERNKGLEGLEQKDTQKWNGEVGKRGVGDYYPDGKPRPRTPERNIHPTVKPVQLMRYLIRLVTPKGGTVLDPFLGSGTTAVAAIREGVDWIGCEREAEYVEIARARVADERKGFGL